MANETLRAHAALAEKLIGELTGRQVAEADEALYQAVSVSAAAVSRVPAVLDAIDAVLALHYSERFAGEDVCHVCLKYTSPLPGRVAYPCKTVQACTDVQP